MTPNASTLDSVPRNNRIRSSNPRSSKDTHNSRGGHILNIQSDCFDSGDHMGKKSYGSKSATTRAGNEKTTQSRV